MILDWLDENGRPRARHAAAKGVERRHQLWLCALATGLGDKSVSLVYESALRREQLKLWVDRCEAQITGALDALEKECAAIRTPYLFGERIGHADIAVACVLRFTREAHSRLFDGTRYPSLKAHAARCEALPAFAEIVQPLCRRRGEVRHSGMRRRDKTAKLFCAGRRKPGIHFLTCNCIVIRRYAAPGMTN